MINCMYFTRVGAPRKIDGKTFAPAHIVIRGYNKHVLPIKLGVSEETFEKAVENETTVILKDGSCYKASLKRISDNEYGGISFEQKRFLRFLKKII